jgi:hypothetical protein
MDLSHGRVILLSVLSVPRKSHEQGRDGSGAVNVTQSVVEKKPLGREANIAQQVPTSLRVGLETSIETAA